MGARQSGSPLLDLAEGLGIHPYTLKFPMMRSDEQLADLADDIARNGQRAPIDITPGGLISSSCRSNKTRRCHS